MLTYNNSDFLEDGTHKIIQNITNGAITTQYIGRWILSTEKPNASSPGWAIIKIITDETDPNDIIQEISYPLFNGQPTDKPIFVWRERTNYIYSNIAL